MQICKYKNIKIKQKTNIHLQLFMYGLLGLGLLLLGSCAFPGSTKPVIKIGLIAPFEGEQRANGYQQLYGVKLALQEVNLKGGVAGYKFALIALNDFADETETILQAQELVLDSHIRGIIGHGDPHSFQTVAHIYMEAQLLVVNPREITDITNLPPTFAADFEALGGSKPDIQAQQAYLATQTLLQTIEQVIIETDHPQRADIWLTASKNQ